MGLTKVAPVITKVGAYDAPALTLMNKANFEKLPKPLQEALIRAGDRTPSAQYRSEIRSFEGVLYGMHEKAGGQIVTVTQDQRDAWRQAVGIGRAHV